MSQQELFDYVMNTLHNTNPAILKQKIKDISGASSWNDLKDKPFGEEEKKTIVYETEPMESGWISIPWQKFEDGKEYAYCVDGVMYTGNARYNDTDAMYCVELYENNDQNNKCVGWIYERNIFLDSDYFDSAVPHKIERVETIVHKLDGKYLPDPFWVEEKKTLVVEGLPDKSWGYSDNIRIAINIGEEYIYSIDGIEYTGIGYYDSSSGNSVDLKDANGTVVAWLTSSTIDLGPGILDINASHKIELVEKAYHTHHDFMMIIKENDATDERDVKLVAGDFATAKAKLLKGLPATAYICYTIYDEGWQEVRNGVDTISYIQEPEGVGEICILDGFGVPILPDNTIMTN